MPDSIKDGKGQGNLASVNNENRLAVTSISSTVEHHVNHHEGEAYILLFEQSPAADDDCILYIQNTSEEDLVIEGIDLSVDGACQVYYKLNGQGTRNNATAITPANVHGGINNDADGVFEQGADLDGGSATLTNGEIVGRHVFRAAANTSHCNFPQDIIVSKSATFTVWCDTSSVTVIASIPFNYHSLAHHG